MQRTVILINGKARCGKSTLASLMCKYLQPNLKAPILKIHNGDKVKELAKDFFKWDGAKTVDGRQLLLDITNAGYNYDPYFWEQKSIDTIVEKNAMVTIIQDWRYISTYEYFKACNFNVITIHLERTMLNNDLSDKQRQDKSEQKFSDKYYDYQVINARDNLDYVERVVRDYLVPKIIEDRMDENCLK